MKLTDALRMAPDEVVALVGGGGKTTAMFRLAREVVEGGGRAITTTTTRIFGAQIALAPAHVPAASVTRERLAAELALHRHVLVIGATDADSGKAEGISLDLFRHVRAWFPDVCLLNEADGSRMRPFKAPADYEPVIPADTTLVAVVVGADVLGRSLDAEHVHRPELVATLSGAPMGAPITPALRGFMTTHARKALARSLASAPSWKTLGCDRLPDPSVDGVGAGSVYSCYAASEGGRTPRIFTVLYTGDWKASWIESYSW